MAYSPPAITASGLSLPSYVEIRDDLVDQAKTIYGAGIYLGPDSQDYQIISALASKAFDAMQALQLAYNARGPAGAIGSALDILVKLNGIARKPATYSTVPVTLTGTVGTVINNGLVGDVNGNQWSLPSPTTIGIGGTVTVTATALVAGAVAAAPGEVSRIVTPTLGWTSVTNADAATPGAETETDPALRARQAVSGALPSLSTMDALRAAVSAVSGVTRSVLLENDTNATDADGLPAHSVAVVAEGGTDGDVAAAIKAKKGLGVGTVGTTTVNITDAYGLVTPIKFYRVAYVDIAAAVSVTALAGYTSATTDAIKAAIAAYLGSLAVGADVQPSVLWAVAQSVQTLTSPVFAVTALTAGVKGGSLGTSPIAIAFNEAARGAVGDITVTVS